MKTSELSGSALDWAVAYVAGFIDDETVIVRKGQLYTFDADNDMDANW